MIRRQHVVKDFFEQAEALREYLDTRFSDPYGEPILWTYFCHPQIYTYLRTNAGSVFPKPLFDSFMHRMRSWCMETLGLMVSAGCGLHLMVNGCRIGFHNDFQNGLWGFVFSLTRWDTRRFAGGETLLIRDGIPNYKKHHVHGEVLYELIPAHFNQLLIFDDRLVHGTPTIEGSMNPLEARIAFVGHIRAVSPVIEGHLQADDARKAIAQMWPQLRDRVRGHKEVQGTCTYRLSVRADGVVDSVKPLTDNLITPMTGYERTEAVEATRSLIQLGLKGMRFPAAAGASTVTLPVLLPMPDLRPIESVISHNVSAEALCDSMAQDLESDSVTWSGMRTRGVRKGQTFHIQEPVAGLLQVERGRVVASLDAPMWAPSQRERLQTHLQQWIEQVSARVRQ
jgi:hypothetical protein